MKSKTIHMADGSKTLCRFWGSENWAKTKDRAEVTCKKCLAALASEDKFQRAVEYFEANKEELTGVAPAPTPTSPSPSPAMLTVLDLVNGELKARGAHGCFWQLALINDKALPVHRFILFEDRGVNAGAPYICEMIETQTTRAMYEITRSLSRYHARRVGDGWRY